jgi:hypothetical protein
MTKEAGILFSVILGVFMFSVFIMTPQPELTYVPIQEQRFDTLMFVQGTVSDDEFETKVAENIELSMGGRVNVDILDHKYVRIVTNDDTFDLMEISDEDYDKVRNNLVILSMQVRELLGENMSVVFTTYDMKYDIIFFIYEDEVQFDIRNN